VAPGFHPESRSATTSILTVRFRFFQEEIPAKILIRSFSLFRISRIHRVPLRLFEWDVAIRWHFRIQHLNLNRILDESGVETPPFRMRRGVEGIINELHPAILVNHEWRNPADPPALLWLRHGQVKCSPTTSDCVLRTGVGGPD